MKTRDLLKDLTTVSYETNTQIVDLIADHISRCAYHGVHAAVDGLLGEGTYDKMDTDETASSRARKDDISKRVEELVAPATDKVLPQCDIILQHAILRAALAANPEAFPKELVQETQKRLDKALAEIGSNEKASDGARKRGPKKG